MAFLSIFTTLGFEDLVCIVSGAGPTMFDLFPCASAKSEIPIMALARNAPTVTVIPTRFISILLSFVLEFRVFDSIVREGRKSTTNKRGVRSYFLLGLTVVKPISRLSFLGDFFDNENFGPRFSYGSGV